MIVNLPIHHIGKVVKDIREEYSFYTSCGFRILRGFESKQVDQFQKVYVGVVVTKPVLLELLEPLSVASPIHQFLKKGRGLHHLCYETKHLKETIDEIKKKKIGIQVTPVTPSVWEAREVVFFVGRNKDIFEVIEKK